MPKIRTTAADFLYPGPMAIDPLAVLKGLTPSHFAALLVQLKLDPAHFLPSHNEAGLRALQLLQFWRGQGHADSELLDAVAKVTAATSPPGPGFDAQAAKNELVDLLTQRFRQSERETLLFRLGLDPEDVKLVPESREVFARAMVLHAENRGRLAELWDEVYRQREVWLRGRHNPFR